MSLERVAECLASDRDHAVLYEGVASVDQGSKSEQILERVRVHGYNRRKPPMTDQFENTEATRLEDETISDATAEKKIERVADKAAEKSTKTEQRCSSLIGPSYRRHVPTHGRETRSTSPPFNSPPSLP
jgi:hypothetical protein